MEVDDEKIAEDLKYQVNEDEFDDALEDILDEEAMEKALEKFAHGGCKVSVIEQ